MVHSPTRTLPGLNGHKGLNLLYMGLILVNKAFRLDIFHKFLVALYACECPKRFITARALTLCYTWQVSIKERISIFFVLYCMLLLYLETILNNPLYYFVPETSPKPNRVFPEVWKTLKKLFTFNKCNHTPQFSKTTYLI